MKQIIVNADDFGLASGINKGIIEAHRNGILTSASLMVNMPGYEEALVLARQNPELGIGVHLNILRGPAVLPRKEILSLVDAKGNFLRTNANILFGLMFFRIKLGDIRKELQAQIDKVLNSGIRPTHLDSEKHLHLLPGVINIVLDLARDKGIRCVRWINEPPALLYRLGLMNIFRKQTLKCLLLNILSRKCRALIEKGDLITTDKSFGISATGCAEVSLYEKLFLNLSEGSWEIITHPGYVDDQQKDISNVIGGYFINRYREAELKVLTSPLLKGLLKSLKISLINFRGLNGRADG